MHQQMLTLCFSHEAMCFHAQASNPDSYITMKQTLITQRIRPALASNRSSLVAFTTVAVLCAYAFSGCANAQISAEAPAGPSLPASAPVKSAAPQTLSVFFIGNSVTDTIRYGDLQKLAESRGHTQIWGRQMIPGAPLEWLWDHPKDGFAEEPFGLPQKALPEYHWDAISLQAFDRLLDGDVKASKNFIDLARKNPKNADTQFLLYARWPRMSKGGKSIDYDKNNFGKDGDDPAKITDYSTIDDWATLWNRKYTSGWDNTNESKDYFETLTQTLRREYPDMAKPIVMVPVGHVMAALDTKMKAGEVPGHKSIWDVYADGIHLNKIGSYIVACTYYATLYKEDPRGLPGAPYNMTDEKLNRTIQETVWAVVSTHPLAGVVKKSE